MDFIKDLNNDSFLLIPYNLKDKVLDYIDKNNLLLNIKLISFGDLKRGLLFDYNSRTIYELMKKENISYGLAIDYIKNMYYITEDSYKEDKLNNLLSMKNYLLDNNYLIKDELFIDLLKSKKKIYVYGFDYINKFNKYLLDLAAKYIEIEEVDKEINNYKHNIYEAKTMEDEVLFVAEEISKLIKDGISLDKIYITGLNDEYDFTLRRIFKAYDIPYFIKNENILYDTAMAKYFFDNLSNDLDKLFKDISKKYDIDNNLSNNIVYNKLFYLANNYYFEEDKLKIKDIMIEEAMNTTLPSIHMEQEIKTTNIYDNIFNDDEYVFLMNFNQGSFPKIKKDEDYINDSIKPDILETVNEINIINKDNLINIIKSIKNLTITYKLKSAFDSYEPSYLVREYFKDDVVKIEEFVSNYSNDINKILYGKKLDSLIKFKINDDLLPILSNTYDIDYNEYDNSFTGLKTNITPKNFSYSSMSNFFKCPFRYYCNNVLYLNEFNKNNNLFIGSIFHHVLENWVKDNSKDIDELYDEYLKINDELPADDWNKYELTNKDKFFIDKVRDEIHIIIDIIKEQNSLFEQPNKQIPELEVSAKTITDLKMDTKFDANLYGKVDKVVFIGNDVFVIDYKTGESDKIVRNTFEYGLHVQLPIYMYLLEETNVDYNVAGIYLQYILTGNNKKEKNKTLLEEKYAELKLKGLYNPDYNDKLGGKENMTVHPTRVYTNEEKEEIKNKLKELMTNCINDVYDANFEIKPININDGAEDGCQYCPFHDVCYMTDDNYNYINNKNVKGDDNNE